METFLITIFIIGIISALFGILLIFAPNVILKFEEKANILYMTDTAFLKNRIPLGVAMLGISGFLSYTYSVTAINEIIFLLIAVVAGLFGILVHVSLKKMNIDPAIASSVFVTTITDVIGFLSFLGIGAYFFY